MRTLFIPVAVSAWWATSILSAHAHPWPSAPERFEASLEGHCGGAQLSIRYRYDEQGNVELSSAKIDGTEIAETALQEINKVSKNGMQVFSRFGCPENGVWSIYLEGLVANGDGPSATKEKTHRMVFFDAEKVVRSTSFLEPECPSP